MLSWRKTREYRFTYALIFTGLFLTHLPLLRLPYFWDEAGYFIPAARDLLLTGSLIPYTTLSNAHPPLVMLWLAFWWKFSAFTPAVTRTAMLFVAAFALLGLWRLARDVSTEAVAVATVLCTALYPVFFAQSSLAHLDMMAAAMTLWGLAMYVERRPAATIMFFALAPLAKETAIVAPLALFAWELVCPMLASSREASLCFQRRSAARTFSLLLCVAPLAAWLVYHHHRTGFYLGNPEYLRYNLGATLNPLRIVLAILLRLWQVLGYLNLFLLTAGAAVAMWRPPLREPDGLLRPRIVRQRAAPIRCGHLRVCRRALCGRGRGTRSLHASRRPAGNSDLRFHAASPGSSLGLVDWVQLCCVCGATVHPPALPHCT